jgi:HK97 family phage major capsid protein
VAEGTEATDNAPTLVQPSITVTKAHAFVPFSIEVSEDWDALQSEMARMIQQGKDEEEGSAFVIGVGTTVFPQGVTVGTTTTVAASTGLTVTAANVYALEAALPPRFRPNESFVANRGIYNVVRGIDTAGGAALWLYVSQGLVTQAPTPGNTGATLLGRGAWEASAMQATVVNATKIMICGDFSYFKIVDRVGMNVEVVPHIFGATSRFPIGQRGLYAYWRNSSRVLSAAAFVALTGTT